MAASMLVLEEMLDRGDPAFVEALREFHDADQLGKFAAKWFHDRRPESRRLLFEYLDRPLNAYRHEALVKRLFKLAEKAGDDELLGRFLVCFDRAVRRVRKRRHHYNWRTRESWEEDKVFVPKDTVMPRENPQERSQYGAGGSWREGPAKRWLARVVPNRCLYSVHTRNYLRRRTWRYFRLLGKKQADRYLPAITGLLKRYSDDDTKDGLALLDNWGLIHILFHDSPVLVSKPHGWNLAAGRGLGELAPAPYRADLWKQAPQRLIELLKEARCRPVRRWVIRLIEQEHGAILAKLPIVELLELLQHEDADVVALAAEALRQAPGLDRLPLERWLELLETTTQPTALEVICELMGQYLRGDQLTLEQVVKLAMSRPLPTARLGLKFLQAHAPRTEEDCQALLGLAEAESEQVRPELVKWARGVLSKSALFQPAWVLEFLDSRHEDVRAEGWLWFQEEPRARDDVSLWRRLLESPYDDVRLELVASLERRVAGREHWLDNGPLDPELIRLLWASVLLNVQRGNRSKPGVVRQLVRRLSHQQQEAAALLPILSVALRSVRGPEWRTGLCGIVQLVERRPELENQVREAFPELKLA